MIHNAWEVVGLTLVSLGIFELVKTGIQFIFSKTAMYKQREMKEIARRVFVSSSWLKLKDFEEPLDGKVTNQLYYDAVILREFDEEFADDIIKLVTLPSTIKFLSQNRSSQPQNYELIVSYKIRLHEMTEKLHHKCQELKQRHTIPYKSILLQLRKYSAHFYKKLNKLRISTPAVMSSSILNKGTFKTMLTKFTDSSTSVYQVLSRKR